MKKIGMRRLPPIFKMSMLWNILPYYGYIHRWRLLLTKINSETQTIWEENQGVFMYLGRNMIKERNIIHFDRLDNVGRDWIDMFSLSVRHVAFNKGLKKIILSLLEKLEENEVIVFDFHKSKMEDIKIDIWKEENISDILPASLCPLFKKEKNILMNLRFKSFFKWI